MIVVSLLIAAAVVSVLAHKSGQGWVTAISYTLFGLAVIVYLRWRQRLRARVLDREEKTRE